MPDTGTINGLAVPARKQHDGSPFENYYTEYLDDLLARELEAMTADGYGTAVAILRDPVLLRKLDAHLLDRVRLETARAPRRYYIRHWSKRYPWLDSEDFPSVAVARHVAAYRALRNDLIDHRVEWSMRLINQKTED